MKKGLVLGIIALFIVSSVSPMVIGYETSFASSESSAVLGNLPRPEDEIYYYNPDTLNHVLGLSGGTPPYYWYSAVRFTQDELAPYVDWPITKVIVALSCDNGQTEVWAKLTVWGEGTSTSPGNIIYEDDNLYFDETGFHIIEISTPIALDDHDEIWIGIEWEQTEEEAHIAFADDGPAVDGKGDWFSIDGGASWQELRDTGLDYNWGMGAIVGWSWPPFFNIRDVKGPIGVNAVVENVGEESANNLEWSITITGGILDLVNKHASGTKTELAMDETLPISSGLILGFGKIFIEIIADADNAYEVSKLYNAFILGPFVFGVKSDSVSDVNSEMETLLDNLAFYCYDASGNNAKYEYMKEQMLNDYSDDEIDIVEDVVQPVEPISTASSGGPMDSPWPMKCHDTHHTSRSPYSTAHIDGLEKWRFRCDGVDGSPIIGDDGTIYFGDKDADIYAIYPNGTLKWTYHTDMWITSAPALAGDGTLYVTSWDEHLYAFNSSNGVRKWRFNAGHLATLASSPIVAEDGTIYFGAMGPDYDRGRVYAVNPNGTEKWYYDTGDWITSDPAIGDDGTIYIGSGDTYFYAINPNGTLKWRFKTGDYIKGPASIAEDGTVYIGSFDGYLYALYPNNGTMKWKYNAGTETNPSIASDGTIYVGSSNKLHAIYPNGTKRWTFTVGEQYDHAISQSSPAISADGTIYVGTQIDGVKGGDIIAVNPDGTEKWRKLICFEWIRSSPCIGEDGTVYIGCATDWGGYIHAFGPVESNSPPETPTISGETNGNVREDYEYKLRVVDPDNNPISFYIDWGDGFKEWTPERASGENCYYEHTWLIRGDYTIRCKAKDTLGEESDWASLEVTMPRTRAKTYYWLEWLRDRYPLLEVIISRIMGL